MHPSHLLLDMTVVARKHGRLFPDGGDEPDHSWMVLKLERDHTKADRYMSHFTFFFDP